MWMWLAWRGELSDRIVLFGWTAPLICATNPPPKRGEFNSMSAHVNVPIFLYNAELAGSAVHLERVKLNSPKISLSHHFHFCLRSLKTTVLPLCPLLMEHLMVTWLLSAFMSHVSPFLHEVMLWYSLSQTEMCPFLPAFYVFFSLLFMFCMGICMDGHC